MAKKQPTINQLKATNQAYELRSKASNDDELAKLLDVSKVTLYTRLKQSDWKVSEMFYINYLTEKYNEENSIT